MLINLPTAWIVTANVCLWPAIHLGVAKLFVRLPITLFCPDAWIFRARRWERNGHLYVRLLGIRVWKSALPDGSRLLRGFSKKRLVCVDRSYLVAFIRETCRGEVTHWVVMACTPLFFLWNPLWADAAMCVYAIAANLPCITAQRFNRIRLSRMLESRENQIEAPELNAVASS